MKLTKLMIATTSLAVCLVTPCCYSQTTGSAGSPILGVFAGTSLCGDVAKPILQIPAGAQCDRIKWNLTLYQDPKTHAPTRYKLVGEYGFHVDNRTYVIKGTTAAEGRWAISKGTKTDPKAAVYQLEAGKPRASISFLKLDQNLLHFLDRDKSLMVGNAAQSYTLSRMGG